MTQIKILTTNTTSGVFYKKGEIILVEDADATALVALGYATTDLDIVELGTASTGVVAKEEGDNVIRKTTLTIAAYVKAIAGAALGFGKELYTFPEGMIKVHQVACNITIAGATETGTPDTGLGTVVASGAVSVLSSTATFEDIMDGFTATAIASASSVSNNYVSAEAGVLDGHTTAKKVFLNHAATWTATENLTISGIVTLFWSYLGDY